MAIKKSELYSSLWSSCDELRGGLISVGVIVASSKSSGTITLNNGTGTLYMVITP